MKKHNNRAKAVIDSTDKARKQQRLQTILSYWKPVVIILILVVVVGGAALYIHHRQQANSPQAAIKADAAFQARLNNATNLMLAGKYDEAEADIQAYINEKPEKKYLTSIYSALAVNYINAGKLDQAKTAYLEAQKYVTQPQQYGVLTGLAQVEERMGNKPAAISYYEQAVSSLGTIDKDDQNTLSDKAWAEYQITILKETP